MKNNSDTLFTCKICQHGVDSINDMARCGHCSGLSCSNCGARVDDGDLPSSWNTEEKERIS